MEREESFAAISNMIRYECDKCGMALRANDSRRFIVKMEIYAAAGHMDFTELEQNVKDPEKELSQIMAQLADADPDDVEDETYRCLRFDLCDACRRAILRKPLG